MKKININSHVYTISSVKNLAKKTGHDAECDFEKKQILIDARLKGDDYMRALLHEIRHGMHLEMGWYEILSSQAQELDAESLASFLVANFNITIKK